MAEAETGAGTAPTPEAQSKEESFDMPTVLTVGAAHLVHDTYTSFVAPLLPVLITKLGIPLSLAGMLPAIFRSGSLAQPFWGAWADRADARYFVIISVTTTALFLSLLGVAPNYPVAVLLLLLGGLSSGAFHPAVAATATRASGNTWSRGLSIYMTGGKLGFALGPLFIVSIVHWFGPENSYLAAIPGPFVSALLFWRLRKMKAPRVQAKSHAGIRSAMKTHRKPLLLLSAFVVLRSVTTVSFSNFYPAYVVGSGSTLLFAGFAMSVYQVAAAAGALGGGTASEIFGRRTMLVGSQLLAGPLLYLCLSSPESPASLAAMAVGGAMIAAAAPVQLALFQGLMPGAHSTAAGIWSFLSFEGSLATAVIVGVLADQIGLGATLGFSVFASMLSIPFILAMEEPRPAEA